MADQKRKTQLPMQLREATVVPVLNEKGEQDESIVELIFTTGAAVRRYDFWEDQVYEEVLSLEPGHVRLDRLNNGAVPLLRDHRNSVDSLAGAILSGEIRDGKGVARAKLDRGDEIAERVYRQVAAHILTNTSIGYHVYKYEVTREEGKLPIYRAVDWELMEISLVAVPADAGAGFRNGGNDAHVEVVELARCADLVDGTKDTDMTLNASERQQPNNGNQPVPQGQAETIDVAAERSAAITGERQRIVDIQGIATRHRLDAEFVTRHIDAGSTIDVVRGAALDALADAGGDGGVEVRNHIALGASNEDPARVRSALVVAMAHSMSPNAVKLEGMAEKYRGYGPMAIAEESLASRGAPVKSRNREMISRAALHSTSDFPYLMADSVNMVLRNEYQIANPSYRRFAARKNFADFRPHSFLSAGDFPALEKIGESGEVKAGTFSESKETMRLDTWARKIGFSRNLLINDNLGAIAGMPGKVGRRIAAQENQIVFAVLNANSGAGIEMADGKAIFHTDHKNKATTGTVIDVANLGKARAAMRKQKTPDGLTLNLMAKILLVGPDKETEAEKVMSSILAATTGEVNPFTGKLEVVADAEIDGNHWYTLCDPNAEEVIAYGYLNGAEAPQVMVKEGFDYLGFEMRVVHDFAAGATGTYGGYYNPGA
ncbi:prohead protease/major capsid protein fusion protein [Thalassospira sp.]|uniref:prohead protease/major capsid protein fusion protein n=1 Tax=Thalassospira sp. TaxID=1912094 RepID=UPI003AA7BEAE